MCRFFAQVYMSKEAAKDIAGTGVPNIATWVESVECTTVAAGSSWAVVHSNLNIVPGGSSVASHMRPVSAYKYTVKILNLTSAPAFPTNFIV